jgi:hypothetical protein
MKTNRIIGAMALCMILATAGIAAATDYAFTVSNSSKTAYCNPLEIRILNNGQQVSNAFSPKALTPGSPSQVMTLKADYCTKIQLKTVCSGQVNQHEKGCSGGSVAITSPAEMAY